LLGEPLTTPVTVYDPEERSLAEDALQRSELLSEVRRCIRHYEIAAHSGHKDPDLVDRVRRIDDLYETQRLAVVSSTSQERHLTAWLQSRDGVANHSINVALGPGEAACVAIAWHRNWTLVTDDTDALTVLGELHDSHFEYERIRKLLIRAANSNMITADEANSIHEEMTRNGFWDHEQPFS
jgi:predicted nucleic acid-binding protein